VSVHDQQIRGWKIAEEGGAKSAHEDQQWQRNGKVVLQRNFEFKLPLTALFQDATPRHLAPGHLPEGAKLRLRFSLWQNHLPVDALPLEGWIELQLLSEGELAALAY
jgi:hypothetical protein